MENGDGAQADGPAGSGGRHVRRWLIVGVALVAVVMVAGWLALGRNRARPVSIDEARARTSTTTSSEDPSGPPSTGGPGEGALVRPAAGVYEFAGSGREGLSLPPLSQDQGPTIPATVEHGDPGCWSIRFDYSTNHWQTWSYCIRDADLVEVGGLTWQRWMIGATAITNLTTSTCDDAPVLPAVREPDQQWPARCTSTNEAVSGEAVSEGPYRYVGEETLEVGGVEVVTAHFVREREMSGAQEGTERSEVWFAVDSGLPVRNERAISVATDTPVGASTYTEDGEFRLTSLEPVG
ncbi:MAG TPA: hypothetical protein PKE56_10980 [Acidimicrobiales bacterium]|jgi:hypothetical protein|nr:hypothetical protein [Acidimicrobiales bacterium]